MRTNRKGRVRGRALAKETAEIAEGSSWNEVMLRAIYGEAGPEITELVQECFRLEKRRRELEDLYKNFDAERVASAQVKWLRLLRGRKFKWVKITPKLKSCGTCEPIDLVRGAQKDKTRNELLYRYYLDLVELEDAENELDKKLGCYVRGCVVLKDVRDLKRIIEAVQDAKPDSRTAVDLERLNWKRLRYLTFVGKSKDGKIISQHPVTRNWLSTQTGLHGKDIDRFNREFGVALRKGKPGRPKK